jgi:hypothetical protein
LYFVQLSVFGTCAAEILQGTKTLIFFQLFLATILLVTVLCDEVGYYRITGRVDDTVIVSGHNLALLQLKRCYQ